MAACTSPEVFFGANTSVVGPTTTTATHYTATDSLGLAMEALNLPA